MSQVVGQIESATLAQIANNALAHFPANSLIKTARVRLSPAGIEITATDSYTAGKDYCAWYDGKYSGGFHVFEVSRECLQGWDSTGRKDKATDPTTGKRTAAIGVLTYRPEDGTTFSPNEETVPPESHLDVTGEGGITPEMWKAIDDMLGDIEDDDIKTCFQPGLLQRFAKVKADKNERVADLAISDPERPVLVKIGPTFKGLIMPVKREKHAKSVGDEEGLW